MGTTEPRENGRFLLANRRLLTSFPVGNENLTQLQARPEGRVPYDEKRKSDLARNRPDRAREKFRRK